MESFRDEVYSERVRCGKRTYFIDVKPTHSGNDFFITISESRRVGEKYEKHKIYLYKEDFSKFAEALERSMSAVGRSLDQLEGNGSEIHPIREPQDETVSTTTVVNEEMRDLSVDDREDF